MLLKVITIFLVCFAFETESLNSEAKKFGNEKEHLNWKTLDENFRSIVDSYLTMRNLRLLLKISYKLKISSDCRDSLYEEILALRKLKGWAVHMADASGKLPSGVLDGTIMDMGSFDGCLKIRVNDSDGREAFRGRHCMVGFQSPMLAPLNQKTPTGQSYVDEYGYPPDWVLDLIVKAGAYAKHAAFWFGICVPSTCSENDIKEIVTSVSKPLKMNVLTAGCQVEEPMLWPTSAIISVCILCVFLGFCILGTLIDAIIRHLSLNPQYSIPDYLLIHILKAFSLLSNTEKLFASPSGDDILGCFHGIRFFSATWIILGHTYFFTDTWKYLKYRNGLGIDDSFNRYLPLAVIENFTIPVGSFFFMSGFLLVYVTWKKLESKGKINLFMFFIHKYWRMTPALGLMIVMFLALPVIGSGPLWKSTLDPPIHACEEHWWTNLLYINNLWESDQYCLIHTWFLAVLMQFHLIGVCLLILTYRWPVQGLLLGCLIAVGTCILTALLVIWNNFPIPAPGLNKDLETMADYNTKIYIKPFCHAPSYLIGMLVAYFILKHKPQQIRLRYQITGWLLATAAALSSVYGMYSPESVETRAFYLACHRIGWTGSVGWLAYACITGHGGIVNRLLSWKVFGPLGNLSYLVYLLHPIIMLFRTASLRERINYGNTEMVFEFLTYTVLSFFLAFIGHVAVEKPFLILDGLFFKTRSSHTFTSKTCHSDTPTLTSGVKTIIP